MYPLHINDVFSDIFVFAILCKLKTTWHDQFLSSLKSMKPDDYFFCFFIWKQTSCSRLCAHPIMTKSPSALST